VPVFFIKRNENHFTQTKDNRFWNQPDVYRKLCQMISSKI